MFDINAQERLGYYVYALFHPETPDCPFYIGKGSGNRIFSHANGVPPPLSDDTPLNSKFELIQEIKNSGKTVIQKIIRFGLSETEALKIEASLIDLINHIRPDALKNRISGHGVAEGIYDAVDLVAALAAKELESDLPLLLIKIEKEWTSLLSAFKSSSAISEEEIFKSTRGDWRLDISRANRAVCVLAIARGLVRAAFVPAGWTDTDNENRKRMTGRLDSSQYQPLVGASVAHLFGRGSQNPIRYLKC